MSRALKFVEYMSMQFTVRVAGTQATGTVGATADEDAAMVRASDMQGVGTYAALNFIDFSRGTTMARRPAEYCGRTMVEQWYR